MNTTIAQTVTEYERHQVDMLLWQADVHERKGKKQEAHDIRAWVAGFLSAQPEEDVPQTHMFCDKREHPFDSKTFS